MLRKPLFTAIFLVSILTPTLSFAQVASSSPATLSDIYNIQQQIAELQVQLKIQLLLEQIASLKAQIEQVLANQTQTNQVVSNLQTSLQSAPVLGVVSSTPVVVTPLKLISGDAGSINSYLYLQTHPSAENEAQGRTSSLVMMTTSKSIDVSKTELWVDGTKANVSFTPKTSRSVYNGVETSFLVSPNIYSFAKKQVDNSYLSTYQFKFSTSEGEQISTYTLTCEANFVVDHYESWGVHRCNNMGLSQLPS